MAFSRKSYKLTSDAERSRVTGIVHEKLLSDYLHRVFASPDHRPAAATSRYGRMALPFLCGARPEAGGWGVGREAGLWGGWLAFCPRSDAPDCETCGPESTRVSALAVLVPPLRE